MNFSKLFERIPKTIVNYISEFLHHHDRLSMHAVCRAFCAAIKFRRLPINTEAHISRLMSSPNLYGEGILARLEVFHYINYGAPGDIDFTLFKSLTSLHISTTVYGTISGLPATLRELYCSCGGGRIETVGLPKLEKLYVAETTCTEFPPTLIELSARDMNQVVPLAGLTRLRHLNICGSEFTDLPPNISSLFITDHPTDHLTNIKTLHTNNPRIPPRVENLTLSGTTVELGIFQYITELTVKYATLDGPLPRGLRKLTCIDTVILNLAAPIVDFFAQNCHIECALPQTLEIYITNASFDTENNLPVLRELICHNIFSSNPLEEKTLPSKLRRLICHTITGYQMNNTAIEHLEVDTSFYGPYPPSIKIFVCHGDCAEDLGDTAIETLETKKPLKIYPRNLKYLTLNHAADISACSNLIRVELTRPAINSIFPTHRVEYKYNVYTSTDINYIFDKILFHIMNPYNGHITAEEIQLLKDVNLVLKRQDIEVFLKLNNF